MDHKPELEGENLEIAWYLLENKVKTQTEIADVPKFEHFTEEAMKQRFRRVLCFYFEKRWGIYRPFRTTDIPPRPA